MDNTKTYKYIDYLKDKKEHKINPDFQNIGKYGENEMDEIVKNVYLGNFKAAYNYKNLLKNRIKNVVIICDNIETPFENHGIKYFKIPVKDRELQYKKFNNSVNVNEYMLSQISKAMIFMFNAIKNNEGVLVHCKKGASRSAYLVKYFLMLLYGLSSEEAEKLIKDKRFIAFPSFKYISKYERPIVSNRQLFLKYFKN